MGVQGDKNTLEFIIWCNGGAGFHVIPVPVAIPDKKHPASGSSIWKWYGRRNKMAFPFSDYGSIAFL